MYSLFLPLSLNRTLIITNDIPRLEWKPCEQILTYSAAEQYRNLGEQAYFAYKSTHWQISKCKGNITANLTCKKKKKKQEKHVKKEMEWENRAKEEWET